jgi:SAM-dependent methyltransferase
MEFVVLAWLILGLLFIGFGLVPLRGAPYLPSLKAHRDTAFELLDLKPGQVIYDLGSGDGRFLKEAAKRGYKAIGYELNPFMFILSLIITLPYRKHVKIRFANFWQADLKDADAIYVFLLTRYMKQLDDKIMKSKKHIKLASHTFKIPGKKPIDSKYGIYLYEY